MFKLILSVMTVLLISLATATAASASGVRWSFTDTPLTGEGHGTFKRGTVSVAGQFDYDAINDTVSNLNVTITINGTSTNITNRLPFFGSYLIFANSSQTGEPLVMFSKSELVQSGNSASVSVSGGECFSYGVTCSTSNYKVGQVTFFSSDPSAAAPSDNAATVANTIIADSFSRAVATTRINTRLMDMSMARFIDDMNSGAAGTISGIISRDAVNGPLGFKINGLNVDADDDGGSLFSSVSYMDVSNGWRRVGFAELSFQDTQGFGSTLSVTGRISQERYLTASTLYGYFLGAELHRSDIEGNFGGDQDSWGVLAGSYLVARAENGLIGSAYGALGFNRSKLEIGDTTTTVTDSYDTHSIMLGAKLSGDFDYTTYRLRPSLATNFVQTHIGTLGMTETTGGTASDLSVAVGTIRFMDIVATPEFVFDGNSLMEGHGASEFTVAPLLTCEGRDAATKTRNCGSGLALGVRSNSSDGMTTLNGGVSFDRIGGQDRRAIQLQAEMRF
jgi:hypothetical protein